MMDPAYAKDVYKENIMNRIKAFVTKQIPGLWDNKKYFKITACVLGYLIVRLGHDTLVKGISGEIDFGFSGSGFQTKLKAGSPGALFVLMGAAIIIWGLAVQKPMEIKMLPSNHNAVAEKLIDGNGSLHRTPVPD